eukprot:353939-Chlamydomonas_euryale.AAC.32
MVLVKCAFGTGEPVTLRLLSACYVPRSTSLDLPSCASLQCLLTHLCVAGANVRRAAGPPAHALSVGGAAAGDCLL